MSFTKLHCPVTETAEFLWQPWNMFIIREFMIFGGTRRFEQLRQALGISRNVLTDRLKVLLEQEIIKRVPAVEKKPRQLYVLRRKGWELMVTMIALHQWADRWDDRPDSFKFVDSQDEKLLAPITLRSSDGRSLGPDGLKVLPLTADATEYLERFASRNTEDCACSIAAIPK